MYIYINFTCIYLLKWKKSVEFEKLLPEYDNYTNLSINDKYGEGTPLHIDIADAIVQLEYYLTKI